MHRTLTTVVCIAFLGILGGCGRTDEGKVRNVVDDYVHARGAGNTAAVCEIYTSEFRRQQGLDPGCPAKLKTQFAAQPKPSGTTIVAVKVHDGQSRVDLNVDQGGGPSRVTLGLIDKDGHWRIAAIN
ncbi:MAG: hypothetical protein QOD60_1023 [Solirubrobacterales bacterium]|jgi:hypothetical protein|nr:hypothetical protein [Solirubrobacterales bacterium]